MKNWKVSPAEVFAASPVVPVMVISDLEQAVPMAQALLAGGISVFEITLRTPVALAAIERIAKAMPEAMVGAGTVINTEQYDAAVAAGARFVISPGMTPALLAHAAKGTAPLIPGLATASEVMQALEAGYDHIKFFPAEANGGTKALAAITAPLSQVRVCPTGGIGPKNVADYLALKCVATVGGSWMLPADAIKAGNWDEVTRLSREAVALTQR
ncbi:bifunctional 4-hydroxy-2-oxoglutarate aldolase/2-dehydro-3-deoxy-phosphogluconate aldolase [Aeromonas simiae]|uniref:bifunctional 4-hydroxy-2-oxoglutarate aldolase/2-dehydro-3-deoxy-phosphogluconate aldolase n=1 Tax=Aeromonas simiae TaxID=218936 RepID=UPI00266DB3E3|nr:bifunctional 4-hydroxy-2-oxoglutarate aldolase/2-dehydro-3-deoxy-phosphogluconate aldolase [Aeromonas simiae]MDO2948698.1 bifunctional 4-hydroxy-2-oxoglutarate aldolase/2-dehydro-3-deoxy-phosphogluconate aldolase [Aeromonas simiae]MDO2952173.1 bifunctional 4-hydroxy-2-oxoglutarate aldolase/2-dehydro-3-deoxy-phosphogluconate aldolase [Aeromonas simiae]MDO2956081.1 bifunctional 4-hydroxy-2-oxoglutarate aldolase/2-dehydro-3-deoxy-phosphogluconate aldolase [Aeromonas simiae]